MDKSIILQSVKIKIAEKISKLETLIEETRSSNNDTKSSMGDKYETGREMLQQEINNLQIQLNENRSHENILKSLNSNPHKMSGLGSLVQTDAGFFYISVSAGEILHEKIKIFAVSADSPVAKEMDCSLSLRVFSFWNSRTLRMPRTVMMPHRKIIKISSSATVPPWLFGGSVRPVPYTLSSQG